MSVGIIWSFKCARCESEHNDVEIIPLTNPAQYADVRFNFWAMCPTRLEPMFISFPKEYEDGLKRANE